MATEGTFIKALTIGKFYSKASSFNRLPKKVYQRIITISVCIQGTKLIHQRIICHILVFAIVKIQKMGACFSGK